MNPTVRDEELREALARGHLRALVASLPDANACDNGLCVDRAPAPSVRFDGKARMSLLRVYSKTAGRARLVGQVHVVAPGTDRETWTFHYLAHNPFFVAPTEMSDRKAWWSAVLAGHLAASGLAN
ncbi:MAG TPA: hypothetical protein VM681_03925 [Candidatus Thermoplasmatota archaeon]|nr:hypothetical protein [Candidatus Thermoplasmatota archaeon]